PPGGPGGRRCAARAGRADTRAPTLDAEPVLGLERNSPRLRTIRAPWGAKLAPCPTNVRSTRHGLVVELDGHAVHGTRTAFERDRARDRAFQAAGWRVIRVTWRQLHE